MSLDLLKNGREEAINLIIRPPRSEYEIEALGPSISNVRGKKVKRTDFELVNSRGLTLQCSYYEPVKRPKRLPCVIYCHGNCGSRLDASDTVRVLLPMNITVIAFDFSGSGLSGGQYVTLGYYEKLDLECVVDWLRKSGQVTRIGLWGRSMGAVTSLLFGATDPSIACLVADSPFASLSVLSMEIIEKAQTKIPKMVIKMGIKYISKSIKKQANFDISKLEPIKEVEKCFIPCLFAHGEEDDFIDPRHSKMLYEKYSGDKNLILFDGDHNSPRPGFYFDSVSIFFSNNLLIDADFNGDNAIPPDDPVEEVKYGKLFGDDIPLDLLEQIHLSEIESQSKGQMRPSSLEEEEEQIRKAILLSMQENSSDTKPNQPESNVNIANPNEKEPTNTKEHNKKKKKKGKK